MGQITVLHPNINPTDATLLTADVEAGSPSFSVANGLNFGNNNYLVLGTLTTSRSELVLTSGSPTATTVNLAGVTSFSHERNVSVQSIPYNQIDIQYSLDLAALFASGAYATLAEASAAATWVDLVTTDITPSEEATLYDDGSTQERSYRSRFRSEVLAVTTNYGSPVLPKGFEEASVGKIIDKALSITNKQLNNTPNGQITSQFLIDELNVCLRKVHQKRKRWSWNEEFDFVLSRITSGKNEYVLPTNIDINYTKRSMSTTSPLRIDDIPALRYIDKREYDARMLNTHQSTLATTLTTVSTTVQFEDTADFPDSGNFAVITGSTQDNVSFTANNRDTNTLTLATSSGVTVTHAIGTDVWANGRFGIPREWTIWSGKIYLFPIPFPQVDQRNISIDFYKKMQTVTNVGDYIIFPDLNIPFYHLCRMISWKVNNGDMEKWQAEFDAALRDLIMLEVTGQRRVFVPNVNTGGTPQRSFQDYQWGPNSNLVN